MAASAGPRLTRCRCAVKQNLLELWRHVFVLGEGMLEVDCVSVTPDRVLAGGSYRSNVRQVTSANRGDIGPGSTRPVVGLRVVNKPH